MANINNLTKKIDVYNYKLIFWLILLFAIFLRIWNLDKIGFSNDEILHVEAAKSLLDEGEPKLASGFNYTRALPYTKIVSFFFKYFGVNEFSARLPSVLINLIFILISYWVVRKLLGKESAIIYLFLVSFSPMEIEYARYCRMYSLFQLLYFITVISFYLGIESKDKFGNISIFNSQKENNFNIFYILISIVFFYFSFKIHLLSVTIFVTMVIYLMIMTIISWRRLFNFSHLKYPTLFFILLFITTVFVINNNWVLSIIREPLDWAKYAEMNYKAYFWLLHKDYPVILFLYPISVGILIKEYKYFGIYLMSSFLPVIIFLSVFVVMKGDRYSFHLIPFFLIALIPILLYLLKTFKNISFSLLDNNSIFMRVVVYIIFLTSLFAFVARPLVESVNVTEKRNYPDYKELVNKLDVDLLNRSVIICTEQQLFKYYFQKIPDYFIRSEIDVNNSDYRNVGSQVISNIEELKHITLKNENVLIITDMNKINNRFFFNEKLIEYMNNSFIKSELGFKSNLLVYRSKNMPLQKICD